MLSLAKADEWDEKTIFTFSAPVEIPGKVLLPGTYVFKLADSASDRNIVRVFNKNETQLYGTFLAIPHYRAKPSGKPIITFDERPADSPEPYVVAMKTAPLKAQKRTQEEVRTHRSSSTKASASGGVSNQKRPVFAVGVSDDGWLLQED